MGNIAEFDAWEVDKSLKAIYFLPFSVNTGNFFPMDFF